MADRYPHIKEFQSDYERNGAFELERQAPHLARLADHYVNRYNKTEDWTDCLKAHALYNSAAARRPDDDLWSQKAFEVQQKYLGPKCRITYKQQREMTDYLKAQLKTIRKVCRAERMVAEEIEMKYEDDTTDDTLDDSLNTDFYYCMKHISLHCTEMMADFAGKIIEESVSILRDQPPCEFQAVAIGSIARAEATPYSDLEYLFLIEKDTAEAIHYFEALALTSYFLIGNLQETKLSYMAIEELQDWFDDKAKNGFKIDGLTKGAGNIPTGNGNPKMRNHFIVTPEMLADRYEQVLLNPQEEALRGDLTAMLSYAKPLYSYRKSGRDLLAIYRGKVASLVPNDARKDMNAKMLQNDLEKFTLSPMSFQEKGFNVNVKKELYRLPSIILLDLSIVLDKMANTSWATIDLFSSQNILAPCGATNISFCLAAAVYIRLSAYLYHDSHDDRMSVAQHNKKVQDQSSDTTHSYKRWFLSFGLFTRTCSGNLILRHSLGDLQHPNYEFISLYKNPVWSKIITQCCSGRFSQALASLKQIFGDNLCEDPVSAIGEFEILEGPNFITEIILETFYDSFQRKSYMLLHDYLVRNSMRRWNTRDVMCLLDVGRFDEAIDILETHSFAEGEKESVYTHIGIWYKVKCDHENSQKYHVLALQEMLNRDILEGSHDSGKKRRRAIDIVNIPPADRLCHIKNPSSDLIGNLVHLGDSYMLLSQIDLSNAYFGKALELAYQLYGEEANVPDIAHCIMYTGDIHACKKQYDKAEKSYRKAMNIHQKTVDIKTYPAMARIHHRLGNILYLQKPKTPSRAKSEFARALARFHIVEGYTDPHAMAQTLQMLGSCCLAVKNHYQAQEHFHRALTLLNDKYFSTSRIVSLCYLGKVHDELGEVSKAKEVYWEALRIDMESHDQTTNKPNEFKATLREMQLYVLREPGPLVKKPQPFEMPLPSSPDDLHGLFNELGRSLGDLSHH